MTAVAMTWERREFSRCPLDGRAELRAGVRAVACRVRDVSLRGALVTGPGLASVAAVEGQRCTLTIHLGAGAAAIVMRGALAHVADGAVRVACSEVDVDGLAHLRRILELNLADDVLVRRELSALAHARRD